MAEKTTSAILFGASAAPAATPAAASTGDGRSTEAVLFSASADRALRDSYRQSRDELGDVLGLSSDELIDREATFTSNIRAAGLDASSYGKTMYEALATADVADQRGRELDTASVQRSVEATRRAIRDKYGREQGDKLIAQTQAFVKQHGWLAEALSRRDLGARKDLVLPLVEHVRQSSRG